MTEHSLARRDVIKAAGAGLATSLLAGATAQAQAPAAAPGGAEFWTAEYTAKKGDVSLAIYRKRVGAPVAGGAKKPVLFLVHGSSNAALSSYDLTVPGRGEYSMMNVFARLGYDVWTMDHEGYGKSSRTSGNSDIASGVEDLKAAMPIVVRESGQDKAHMFGTSSGAIRAGAYAMAQPERVDRLVLAAFTYKGEDAPTLTQRAKQLDYYRTHNTRLRDRDMIRSIFTRDSLPEAYDQAVAEALADVELKFGDQVPTGTYLDMTSKLPLVDPTKVLSPVLMLRGDHDGISTNKDLLEFYDKLPNGDRQFVILPKVAHSITNAKNRALGFHAMQAFLTMPPQALS
ncbi:MAG TPA: alpha/beta fold hydrolase [Xanthobacteraceae bacterium]|jgi:alpha-beta hydrolase superfamily lysophospholipase|nr:alpha/beta fold hydrolase [Xanthobacteraceae bacterium]